MGLLWAILLSVTVVMLESVSDIKQEYGVLLRYLEWVFTILFTVEYLLRIYTTDKPKRYIGSFFGIIDLLSILPTYIGLFFVGSQYLLTIRIFRLLRVFRVLKLVRYSEESEVLAKAVYSSRRKIIVFLGTVFTIAVIMGTIMYIIEPPESGFTSIPRSIYWAIVTLTTVGYGDIAPITVPGQFLAAFIMILGYGVIAVPTGIVSVEYASVKRQHVPEEQVKKTKSSGYYCNPIHFDGFYIKKTYK